MEMLPLQFNCCEELETTRKKYTHIRVETKLFKRLDEQRKGRTWNDFLNSLTKSSISESQASEMAPIMPVETPPPLAISAPPALPPPIEPTRKGKIYCPQTTSWIDPSNCGPCHRQSFKVYYECQLEKMRKSHVNDAENLDDKNTINTVPTVELPAVVREGKPEEFEMV